MEKTGETKQYEKWVMINTHDDLCFCEYSQHASTYIHFGSVLYALNMYIVCTVKIWYAEKCHMRMNLNFEDSGVLGCYTVLQVIYHTQKFWRNGAFSS